MSALTSVKASKVGLIYCIRDDDRGAVKIGFSQNPNRRLAQLQTGNASELRLICTIKSTVEFERLMHRSFASRRGLGEWFDDADGHVSKVLAMASGGGA